jgi:hypothetical protein
MTPNRWSRSSGRREPAELLKPVVDPAAWYPAEMANSECWIYRLSNAENDEIEAAVRAAESRDILTVGKAEFPLPRLAPVLAEVQHELMRGRGFALLRGVRLERMTKAQRSIAFWGVGAHIGRAIPQNGKGHVLDHVKFAGGEGGKDRGYTTNAALGFHCDSCDILGLGVVSTGKAGGEHRIVSSVSLYNEMLKTRPDLVKELGGPFYRHRSGDGYGGAKPWIVQRAFNFQDGYFTCRSAGGSILGAQKFPEVPRLTEKQLEALDLFKTMADGLSIVIPFQPGDFFFVMNHTMMHSRTAYEDYPEPERKRHLMRLWLSNGLRPLPPEIAETMDGPPVKGMRKAILEVA